MRYDKNGHRDMTKTVVFGWLGLQFHHFWHHQRRTKYCWRI